MVYILGSIASIFTFSSGVLSIEGMVKGGLALQDCIFAILTVASIPKKAGKILCVNFASTKFMLMT